MIKTEGLSKTSITGSVKTDLISVAFRALFQLLESRIWTMRVSVKQNCVALVSLKQSLRF